MKFELFAARLFSVCFHPLIIPTLGMVLLFRMDSYLTYSIPGQVRQFILLIVFINTALAPALSMLLLKRTGVIKDLLLSERAERIYPVLLTSLFFFLTYYLLRQAVLPSIMYYYLMGATLSVVLTLLVTFWWKISIHMVSMGGLLGAVVATSIHLNLDLTGFILSGILLSGLIGYSRLRLRAHSPWQVYAGFFLGVGVMMALFFGLSA